MENKHYKMAAINVANTNLNEAAAAVAILEVMRHTSKDMEALYQHALKRLQIAKDAFKKAIDG